MVDIFERVKQISTPDVVKVFFPDLEIKRDGTRKLKALCPFHAEATPSFTVFENGWKCFGCGAHGSNIDLLLKGDLTSEPLEAAKMIAEKFGIKLEGKLAKRKRLRLADYADYVNVPTQFLTEQFRLTEASNGIEIPYRDESGNQEGVQVRHRLKKKSGGDGRFSWRDGNRLILYGAWAIPGWLKHGAKRIILCEGTSDVHVAWHNSVLANGVPGANTFKPAWLDGLISFQEIVLIKEPDQGGEQFTKTVTKALAEAEYKGTVKLVSLPEVKDLRDLWLKVGPDFKETLNEAIEQTEPVDLRPPIPTTADLIYKVAQILKRHIFFKDERIPLLISVWVLGTFIYNAFTFYGYLWINSPLKRCGKSLLEDLLSFLCFNATPRLADVSLASLFRIAHAGGTIILDEVESLRGTDKEKYGAIMSVLNSGFQRDGKVPRTERGGDGEFRVVYFNTYSPKVLAGIAKVVDTIEDRSFKIKMTRKTKGEKILRFNLRKQKFQLDTLRAEMATWADGRRSEVEAIYDRIDEVVGLNGLDDRMLDISEPLVSIATYADAESANGRADGIFHNIQGLLLDLAGRREEDSPESIAAFVAIAKNTLARDEKVFILSEDLMARIKDDENLSWIGSYKALGTFLGKFDLVSEHNRDRNKRGYKLTRTWVDDTEARYCPSYPPSEVSDPSQTRSQSAPEAYP